MSHDAVTCGFAARLGRSRDHVAAPGNNREGVNKWCAQASDPLQAGQSGSPTAGPKAQGTSRMVNVWQHDEREVGHQRRKKAAVDYTAAQRVATALRASRMGNTSRPPAAIVEQRKISALLKMLRPGLT